MFSFYIQAMISMDEKPHNSNNSSITDSEKEVIFFINEYEASKSHPQMTSRPTIGAGSDLYLLLPVAIPFSSFESVQFMDILTSKTDIYLDKITKESIIMNLTS